MTTVDVKLNISDDMLAQLQEQANSRNVSLDVVISDMLADYFEEPFEDPTEEEIIASIRESLEAFKAGDVYSVDEVMDILKQEFDFDADES